MTNRSQLSWLLAERAEGEIDEGFLFEVVGFGGAGGGAGAGGALDAEDGAVPGHFAQQRHDVGERAHVGRLFLYPNYFLSGGVGIDGGLQLGFGERIELVEEDDADGHVLAFGALDPKVVAYLPGAKEKTMRSLGLVVRDDVEETVAGEVLEGRRGIGVAEHALGGEDDKGLAPFAQGLAAQEMEVLRGVGGLDDLDVVLGG